MLNSFTILHVINFMTGWQSLLYTTEEINYQQILSKNLPSSSCLHYLLLTWPDI